VAAAGSTHAAFQRSLRAGNLTRALTEARDLPQVSLADALDLLLLIRDQRPDWYERAAARWLGRYCLETERVGLREAVLVSAALAALGREDSRPAILTLAALARERRLRELERALRARLTEGGRRSARPR
jgi:hypothetical protein